MLDKTTEKKTEQAREKAERSARRFGRDLGLLLSRRALNLQTLSAQAADGDDVGDVGVDKTALVKGDVNHLEAHLSAVAVEALDAAFIEARSSYPLQGGFGTLALRSAQSIVAQCGDAFSDLAGDPKTGIMELRVIGAWVTKEERDAVLWRHGRAPADFIGEKVVNLSMDMTGRTVDEFQPETL